MTTSASKLESSLMGGNRLGSAKLARELIEKFELTGIGKGWCPCTWFSHKSRFSCHANHYHDGDFHVDHPTFAYDRFRRRVLITQPYGIAPGDLSAIEARFGVKVTSLGSASSPYYPGSTECIVLVEALGDVLCGWCKRPIDGIDDGWVEWRYEDGIALARTRNAREKIDLVQLVHHPGHAEGGSNCTYRDRHRSVSVGDHHADVFAPKNSQWSLYLSQLGKNSKMKEEVAAVLRGCRALLGARLVPSSRGYIQD